MNRREFAGLSFATMAALGAHGVANAAPKDDGKAAPKGDGKHGEHEHHQLGMRACAEACSKCQRECDACATHCATLLSKGHDKHLTTLMTCQDCADFCAAAAQIVSRGGPFAGLICQSCAEACARCGKECDKFKDDKHMQACAEECRKCEKACREMLEHLEHAKHTG